MTAANGDADSQVLAPDEAFATVGNETRMQILRALGSAEPLSFAELYDRVDIADSGNFTYHLDELLGHFVRKVGDEYALREPGNRIVQAVRSGAVTDAPVLDSTRLDTTCPYCDRPVEIEFLEERVLVRCTGCAGTYAGSQTDARHLESHPTGTVAVLRFPPAGIAGRAPLAVLESALTWTLIEFLTLASGLCPRCAGSVERSVQMCESHAGGDDICSECHLRHALHVDYDCSDCPHREVTVPAGVSLLFTDTDLISFVSNRGVNPLAHSWESHVELVTYEETVLAVDPPEVRFTYDVDGDRYTLTVDGSLDRVGGSGS